MKIRYINSAGVERVENNVKKTPSYKVLSGFVGGPIERFDFRVRKARAWGKSFKATMYVNEDGFKLPINPAATHLCKVGAELMKTVMIQDAIRGPVVVIEPDDKPAKKNNSMYQPREDARRAVLATPEAADKIATAYKLGKPFLEVVGRAIYAAWNDIAYDLSQCEGKLTYAGNVEACIDADRLWFNRSPSHTKSFAEGVIADRAITLAIDVHGYGTVLRFLARHIKLSI